MPASRTWRGRGKPGSPMLSTTAPGVRHAASVISRIWLMGTSRTWAASAGMPAILAVPCPASVPPGDVAAWWGAAVVRTLPVPCTCAPTCAHILGGVLSGLVIVDKPQGWTSHDVVGRMRRLAGTRKVGHAGTLDPMATGVLVLGINKATRLLTYIVGTSKTYTATIRLGQSTVTDDAEGEVTATTSAAGIGEQAIYDGVAALTGSIEQVPSSVSAIKVNGERAYARVRSGEEVKLAARPVTIHRFEIHQVRRVREADADRDALDVDVTVECSSGTYIRALARDLGDALGVGGH